MKYEIPACEIVKLDITDVITTSNWDGDSPVIPANTH